MKKRKFVNSKKTKNFKQLEKDFSEKKELQGQIADLKKKNHQKAKEIIDLREQIDVLETQIEKFQAEEAITDEYVIATLELERLKRRQENNGLSIDEIKAFDTLVKIKRLCSGQSTTNTSNTNKPTRRKSDSDLIKIVKSKK